MGKLNLYISILFYVSLTITALYRIFRKSKIADASYFAAVVSAIICLCSLAVDIIFREWISIRALSFILLSVASSTVLVSSIWTRMMSVRIASGIIVFQVIWMIAGLDNEFTLALYAVATVLALVLSAWGLWLRVRNMRALMEIGTVWTNLGYGVEIVYNISFMMLLFFSSLTIFCPSDISDVAALPVILLACGIQTALFVRLMDESLFVIMRQREGRILESLKISQLEVMTGAVPDTYRELYERLLKYFEEEKPFLRADLTINEVATVIFSNKLYISRAVSHFTGRNFCQFVNYYRIAHAMEIFRDNPNIKVTAMASLSGFNSVVSFNTAFRLFMFENPGAWCRKERNKLGRKKK